VRQMEAEPEHRTGRFDRSRVAAPDEQTAR
jgi:hypothetical protein